MIRKYNLQWADRQLIKDKSFMSKYKRILSQVTRKEEVLEKKIRMMENYRKWKQSVSALL